LARRYRATRDPAAARSGTELFPLALALAPAARAVGTGPDRRVPAALDRAGRPATAEPAVPEGAPGLLAGPTLAVQPAGRLRPARNEAVAGERRATLEGREAAVAERPVTLADAMARHPACHRRWPRHG
jgi:hypothetical protein